MTKTDLFTYLASEQNVHGLDPVAGHGFLCATVVGRPLDNWLSLYFEGQDHTVPDDVKTALVAWRDELLDTLKNEEPIELPFDESDNDGDEVDLSDEGDIVAWSIGFVDAMYADENNNWFSASEEEVADLTLPMVVLSGIADDDDELLAMKDDDELMAEFVNSLEDNLTDLFLLFHSDE